jgi:hypothetical protein
MNPYARALLSAGLAAGLVLLAPSCFDFDQDYENCLKPGGHCIPNDGGTDTGDGGKTDSGVPDAGTPDAGTPDAGTPDAGTPDSGTPDAGTPDAGTPDAGFCPNRLCPVSTHTTPGSTALFAVWGAEPDKVWFTGQFEQFAFWNGSQFTSRHEGPYDSYMYKLWGTSASDIWAVGNYGTILHFNGTQWEDRNPIEDLGGLRGAWSPAPHEVIIAGPKLYHWDAGTDMGTPLTNDTFTYSGVWGVASGQAWAVGSDEASTGSIRERAPDGSWSTPVVYTGTQHLNALHGTSADNVWAVGFANSVLHRTSTGWQVVPVPLTTLFNLGDVWVAPEGDVYITTRSPTVLRREVDGGWNSFTPTGAEGIELRGVYGFSNGELWFSGGAYDAELDEFDGGFAFRYRRQY